MSAAEAIIESQLPALLHLRSELHRYPELSGSERETARRLRDFVRGAGHTNLVENLGGTGLAAVFPGKEAGPTVLIRAELDGLPIEERDERAHRSRHRGVAHLCGHDGHAVQVAALVPALLAQPPDRGRVVLLWQPAEETGEGARAVLADPAFRALAPDYAFALHNVPGYPLGQVLLRAGAFNCASEGLIAHFVGRTAHASAPEAGLSPAEAMCALITAWKGLDSLDRPRRRVTVVHARLGEPAFGTAPGEAWVMATLRTETDAAMAELREQACDQARALAAAQDLGLDFACRDRFAACTNHVEAVAVIEASARELGQTVQILAEPWAWSEDFGSLASTCRGAMFGLGAGEACPGLHDQSYDYPDALILPAARLFHRCLRRLTNA